MKTVCPRGRVGSNPTLSVGKLSAGKVIVFSMEESTSSGEVPKLAEGAPLERE